MGDQSNQYEQSTTQTEIRKTKQESHLAQRIVLAVFIVVEILILFRFFFKLMGANPDNGFVKILYSVTQVFVGIFVGIFSNTPGVVTASYFEYASLIAMVVIALLAWGILFFLQPKTRKRYKETEYIENSSNRKE